jgi:hypothetical protein
MMAIAGAVALTPGRHPPPLIPAALCGGCISISIIGRRPRSVRSSSGEERPEREIERERDRGATRRVGGGFGVGLGCLFIGFACAGETRGARHGGEEDEQRRKTEEKKKTAADL